MPMHHPEHQLVSYWLSEGNVLDTLQNIQSNGLRLVLLFDGTQRNNYKCTHWKLKDARGIFFPIPNIQK